MIPFLGNAPQANIYSGPLQPTLNDDLSPILSGMALSWRDDFNQTTLNAGRWNILAEPGQSQTSSLGPVLEFPDHWGNYSHDPSLVTLSNGILRLGWGVTSGNWRAGGITSASQYGSATTAKASSIYGVTRTRIKVPTTSGNTFGAVWQLPVTNTYGSWPASGEIDGLEWTQTTNTQQADRNTGFSNIILTGGSNSRTTAALSNPSFNLLDGNFHEFAWYRRETDNGVTVDFFVDNRRYGIVEITGSAANPLKAAFYYLITAQLGWWGTGVPPDETLTTQFFEIDWIEQWSTVTVPSGSKTTAAPILQGKGLSLIWQDRLGESDAPTDDRQFFQSTTGSRVQEDPVTSSDYSFPGENNRRLSFTTFDNKPCMKTTYFANQHGWMNYRSQYLPQSYREFGICVDFMYPSGFNLQNTAGANTHGKTMFGILCGHSDFHQPGVPTSRGWAGEATWPEDQWGGALGINWKYWVNEPTTIRFGFYPHVIGAYVNGTDKFRLDKFSNIYSIPGYGDPGSFTISHGSWHRLELYGRMDTNRRDGLLELWIDGVLKQSLPNLDLGGWVGNRGLAARSIGNGVNGDGSLSAGTGQLVGSSGGGWRFRGAFIREMIGGYTALSSLVPRYTGVFYTYNWRVYGKT